MATAVETDGTSRHRGWLWLAVCLLIGAGIASGCGPSMEEIRAQEQARMEREARAREAQEARRRAEEAERARILAIEEAGNAAARAGNLGLALEKYREVLGIVPRYGEQDQRVRNSIIHVVRAMPSPPPMPEEVLRSMVRGETLVKMGGAGNFAKAAREMENAVTAAPWLADAYYNLGIVQEKAEMFGPAIRNLKLCLAAAPQSQSANSIQARIYALEVMQEEQQKLQALAGPWSNKGTTFNVTLEGKKIRIEGRLTAGEYRFKFIHNLEKKGTSLEGTVTIYASAEPSHGCNFPIETVPVSGTLREDGQFMKLAWKQTNYSYAWQGNMCTAVTALGKFDISLGLTKNTGHAGAVAEFERERAASKMKRSK